MTFNSILFSLLEKWTIDIAPPSTLHTLISLNSTSSPFSVFYGLFCIVPQFHIFCFLTLALASSLLSHMVLANSLTWLLSCLLRCLFSFHCRYPPFCLCLCWHLVSVLIQISLFYLVNLRVRSVFPYEETHLERC